MGADVCLLYEEFHEHFRKFEQWHIQQRTACLRAKYEGSLRALFRDLQPDPRNGIEHIWKERHYTILAVDSQTGQLHLDEEIPVDFDFVWLHQGHQVNITNIEGDLCTISGACCIEPGDELTQRIFVHELHDLMKLFQQYWQPRWNQLQAVSASDWERITAFAQAFMPTCSFEVAPLNLHSWRRTVATSKPQAARGADGFSREDLQHVPDSFLQPFLDMLNAVEETDTAWPQQFRLALVLGLAKHEQAHEENHFRPINLFSLCYRTWARLRTKEIIRQMSDHIPPEALGFLPHRETAEVWLTLQSYIEVMLQLQQPFCGMSTDLQKAFNCIGREQVFMIAAHVGIPDRLLRPWKKFLSSFTRRFEIRTHVGDELQSTSGFPEGCPLSIVAMLCVNWTYHVYMHAFCPRVTAYSFVDNLTLASLDPALIANAYFALRTICALFGLTTDDSKTYVWGLTLRVRKLLCQLGFPCLQDASELGGAMTYGLAVRNRALRQRGANLSIKWDKLKRSFAPQLQKYAILPKVFWPKALHGAVNCLVSDGYAHTLRKQAVKALKANGAGSNPYLRLSLSDDVCNDPGYYQLEQCVLTFKRILLKSPDMLPLWQIRMRGYQGTYLPGPFSRLLQCLGVIGWMIQEPPWLLDHEQRDLDLLTVDTHFLRMTLRDAWFQFVASNARHKTMCDLHGLDEYLTLLDAKQLSSHHRALVSALHSGAFISDAEHSKYDAEKPAVCSHCLCPDTRAHWLQCPRFASLRAQIDDWPLTLDQLPACTLNHLLVPRQSIAVQWRSALWSMEDRSTSFCCISPPGVLNHLFVDGACTRPNHHPLKLASWAVVNATMGMAIALGPLTGLLQSISRAELTALVTAIRWAGHHQVRCCIWSDSQSTVQTALLIQRLGYIPNDLRNRDLWQAFWDAMQHCLDLQLWIRWVPSHLPRHLAEDPFEDWVIQWNGHADAMAAEAHCSRPQSFWQLFAEYEAHLDWWASHLRPLRKFYLQVAEAKQISRDQPTNSIVIDLTEEDAETSPDSAAASHLLEDELPINWQVTCRQMITKVPAAFVIDLITWWCDVEILGDKVQVLSEVELVFALILTPAFCFPFQLDGSSTWEFREVGKLFQKPTLSKLLKTVQFALKSIYDIFPQVAIRRPSKPDTGLGLYKSFCGVRLNEDLR